MLNEQLSIDQIKFVKSYTQRTALKFAYYHIGSTAHLDGEGIHAGPTYQEIIRRLDPIYPLLKNPSPTYLVTGPSSVAKFFRDRGWITITNRYHEYIDDDAMQAAHDELEPLGLYEFLDILDLVDPEQQPEPKPLPDHPYDIYKELNKKALVSPPPVESNGILRRAIKVVDRFINRASEVLTGI